MQGYLTHTVHLGKQLCKNILGGWGEGWGGAWGTTACIFGFPLFYSITDTPEGPLGLTTPCAMLTPLSAVSVCKVLQYLGQRKKESSNTVCPVQSHSAHQIYLIKNTFKTIEYIIYKTQPVNVFFCFCLFLSFFGLFFLDNCLCCKGRIDQRALLQYPITVLSSNKSEISLFLILISLQNTPALGAKRLKTRPYNTTNCARCL